MKCRKFLPAIAITALLLPLAACVSPGPQTLAANEGLALADCQQVTGSRIRSSEHRGCEPVGYPFKRFSSEELQATGQIDLVEALRQLDPAFR